MMTEREQIIEGLLDVVTDLSPFAGDHEDWMKVHRAVKYLKEFEPVELIDDGEDFVGVGDKMEITHRWKCGGCGHIVVYCETRPKVKFCYICGREFKPND